MYLFEGIPTVLIGIIVLFILTDKPGQAKFLTEAERNWLVATLARGTNRQGIGPDAGRVAVVFNPKVLLLSLNYLGIITASLGMLIFIPQIIKSLGVTSNMTVGWLTMIPYVCGTMSLRSSGARSPTG